MNTAPDLAAMPTPITATDPTNAAAAPRIKLLSHGFAIDHPDPEIGDRLMADALGVADREAMVRIYERWELSEGPELGIYSGPSLILTGRQDNATGYEDVYPLLPHYPYASFVVLDTAGHNLQIDQPVLFNALVGEWLDRVAQSG